MFKRRFPTIAFLAFAACCAAYAAEKAEKNAVAVVAPGVLDLPVIEGSFIPDDCPAPPFEVLESKVQGCIAYKLGTQAPDGQNWDWAYVDALRKLGWRFEGGAANVYFMERDIPNRKCAERLAMIGWLLGDPNEVKKYGTSDAKNMDWSKIPYGITMFSIEPEPVCGE